MIICQLQRYINDNAYKWYINGKEGYRGRLIDGGWYIYREELTSGWAVVDSDKLANSRTEQKPRNSAGISVIVLRQNFLGDIDFCYQHFKLLKEETTA